MSEGDQHGVGEVGAEDSDSQISTSSMMLRGAVDLSVVERLRADLTQALSKGPDRLLVDLSGVNFMDSMGIGLLLEARMSAHAEGVALYLVDVPAEVRTLLSTSGVLGLFELSTDAELRG